MLRPGLPLLLFVPLGLALLPRVDPVCPPARSLFSPMPTLFANWPPGFANCRPGGVPRRARFPRPHARIPATISPAAHPAPHDPRANRKVCPLAWFHHPLDSHVSSARTFLMLQLPLELCGACLKWLPGRWGVASLAQGARCMFSPRFQFTRPD